ncbi:MULTISPECIES: BldC family transcriptional regulator [Nocardiopsis]|uniref:DNA binding, excisionase family domain protein n=3 Tax=Nocardiopsis alba TaxID=53437 RepID=J7LI67_NOCAA|nr:MULTISPECIES: BldC family transcriptional regulator [Nocardiopsis]AFR08366.1 DNA binding, excisionase family domain protein [Nocardiopsis alba ATCC BAA-2165]AFR10362.1 DNA binding, excisionase family domain protein [Nocardiopsis alba ATCC BAA-2165]MEC3891059.1 BldC family transcriptional regulator [Nocardiopsis sp. LDBS1602]MEC3891172.1 BldC family transcriptional regulator [Nocardiopsis sp. LDBS1602]MEC3891631.1 BldC family transcriptional regulator [Nocardiopsis sp. LDBS1602]
MDLLTPQEVAQAFRVDPKTVRLWAQEGRLRWVRTLGGHRRYFKSDVQRLLTEPGR